MKGLQDELGDNYPSYAPSPEDDPGGRMGQERGIVVYPYNKTKK